MISFLFQGFNPVVPTLLWLPIVLISFSVAWWSYKYLESVTPWKKWALILLRGSVFAILALLLLNPFFIQRDVETSRPEIYIYLDNSQSISVERGDYNGTESYQQIIEQISSRFDEQFDHTFFRFDQEIEPGDEINAEGAVTNIQRVIDHQLENESDLVASVLLSDGINTQGRNPVFAAQSLATPVFTIPVGDTTEVNDVMITNVDYNPVAYTNTQQRYRVDISQEGFENETATVQILRDGELLNTEEVTFPEAVSSHLVEFEDEFREEGFYEYEIIIPELEGEFTQQNNRETFMVEVLDEKTRILSLAFEIHPDVGSIRRLVATDSQNELISATRLGEGQITGDNPEELETDPDLIILHGLPQQDDPLLDWLAGQEETPVLFFLLPSSHERLSDYNEEDFLAYSVDQYRPNVLDVHLLQERDPYSHPLLEFEPQDFRRFPTLKTYRSGLQISPLAEVLFTSEFQRNEMDIPLIITQSTGPRRLTGINGYGWHRFETTANETVSSFFKEFFTDIISWTATSPDHRNLTVEPLKPSFTETENVEIKASLVNERQEPETDATIETRISSGENDEVQTFLMRHTGNGEYRVDIGNLPEGNYTVEAMATKGERQIGENEARFEVSQSTVEFVNTKRDDETLRQISLRSGGEFLDDVSLERMYSYLRDNQLDESVETVTEHTNYLSNHPGWFILALLLLSGEWILRRTVSLP